MSVLRLRHLTMLGAGVEPAAVAFGPKLTVIYGASDTGKSFISKAIDFMLGAKEMKEDVEEAAPYTELLLGLDTPESGALTLGRASTGGRFSIWAGDQRTTDRPASDRTLSPQHNRKSENNISRFLLSEIGLDGALVRMNQQGRVRPVSFRDVARLCIVDETSIQAETSPVLTGQFTTATVEKEIFRLLVDGGNSTEESDVPTPTAREVTKSNAELLGRLIRELEDRPEGQHTTSALEIRLAQIGQALDQTTQAIANTGVERSDLIRGQAQISRDLASRQRDLADASELLARFELLDDKYASDLARLDTIAEVGTLLGYFNRGTCPFCGTALDQQPADEPHAAIEATDIAVSVAAESSKTEALRADLARTIDGVRAEILDLQASLSSLAGDLDGARSEVVRLDGELEPQAVALEELLSARSEVEEGLHLRRQIERLEDLRLTIVETPTVPVPTTTRQTSQHLTELAQVIRGLLQRWGVSDSDRVEFDLDTYDLIVSGRPRTSRGKGMRSILHAALTIGLAAHCIEQGFPHPGFVVLDTPLVTFRGPDQPNPSVDADEAVPVSVGDAFFRYLASDFPGQAIVFENVDPPTPGEGMEEIRFTKRTDSGRYGFFPAQT